MASKIGILRAVAAAVGETPPTDENQATDFLRAMLPAWDSIVADFTTRHAWTWGTQTRTITATSDTPPAPWTYSFALPVDRTLIRDVTDSNGSPVDYDIENGRVLCDDAGPLQLKINVAATPGYWPGDFAACVQDTLEGHAWKGLRDEFNKGQELINKVDPEGGVSGKLHRAIMRDKRQKPPLSPFRNSVYRAFRNTLSRRRSRDG